MERVKCIRCFAWQSFSLELECECVSDLAAQYQVINIVEKQFRKYELTELGLSAILDIHLKLSAAFGKHVTAVG